MESTLLPVGNAIMGWAREGTNWVESPASSWPLTSFPFAAQVAIGYLCCLAIGCVVMPNLPAVPGLYPFKFLYNITQVMLCSYMCIEACIRAYTAGYTLTPCNAFQPDTNPITFILYIFYLSKILDFADTLFIVLEKRWKQLSFLHVYHHTSIFLFYWLLINTGYDGDIYLTIVLNSAIHMMMYTYYFVSMHTNNIWWKSAMTMGQMVQFVTMLTQASFLLSTGCPHFPPRLTIAYTIYIFSLLVLFMQFFIQSYMGGGKKKVKENKEK